MTPNKVHWWKSFSHRLPRRVALVLFVALLLVAGAVVPPWYLEREAKLIDELVAESHAELAAELTAHPVKPSDLTGKNFSELIQRTPLRGLVIYGGDGTVLGSAGEGIATAAERLARAGVETPVRLDGGTRIETMFSGDSLRVPFDIAVRIDSSGVSADLRDFVLHNAAFVLILAVSATVVVMLMLDRIVLRPVLALHESLEGASRDLANAHRHRIAVKAHDELDALIARSNAILFLVSEYFREVTDRNADLLDEVQLRVRAEQAATQAHERLIDALEAATDGFAVFDADDRLLLCNRTYRDLNPAASAAIRPGAAFEDILRTGLENVAETPAAAGLDDWIENRLAMHRRGVTQLLRRTRDGRWVRIIERRTRDGGIVSVQSDVTDLKQREQALAASESRFRSLADSTNDALVVNGLDGRVVFWNKAATRLFGYEPAEIVGQPAERLVPERDRAAQVARRSRIQAGDRDGLIARPFEMDIVNKQGDVFPAELSLSTWSSAEGADFIVGIYRDIRERKRAEAEHDRLQVQLFQAQKNQALGTLAGGIAHDFNNILAIIQGNARLVRDDLADGAPGAAELDAVIRAGDRAGQLVRQILAFARKQPVNPEPLMLRKVVGDALAMMRATLPKHLTLETRLEADGWVKCDATQINQVLLNLAVNARDAMGETPGRLILELDEMERLIGWPGAAGDAGALDDPGEMVTEIGSRRGRLWMGTPPPGRVVALSVTDDGPGIDGEILPRIFDPFFTTKEVGKGTGLGLAVIMGIVDMTGGAIRVDSSPGAGSRFTIYLPACQPAVPADTAAEPARPAGSGRILVVDDEPDVLEVLCRMIQRMGYAADGMESAEGALDAIRQTPERWNLLFTDLNMPGLSGIDLTREVRNLGSDLPIVICTGSLDLAHVNLVSGSERLAYLGKPVGEAELLRAIRHVLGSSAAGDAT